MEAHFMVAWFEVLSLSLENYGHSIDQIKDLQNNKKQTFKMTKNVL